MRCYQYYYKNLQDQPLLWSGEDLFANLDQPNILLANFDNQDTTDNQYQSLSAIDL